MPYREQATEPTAPVITPEPELDGTLSHVEIADMPSSKLIEMITLRMMVSLPNLPGTKSRPVHINGERAAEEFDRRIPRGFR